MKDKQSTLQGTTISQAVSKHLNTLHTAGQPFVNAENSERIHWVLRLKIRANAETYESGDKLFYKRENSNKWKGPGFVIGQDGNIIFHYLGTCSMYMYVRISANRIMKLNDEVKIPSEENVSEKKDH